ncbi:MAG: primosomal protein N' [Ruminococcaceae bacterium]|nr:primosomal protein N' [Oscillospiraceae bacterium]
MTVGELASVYILDVPYHADKPYTYYIPPDMADHCLPGCLVEVPFGKGNRRMTAVVADLPEGQTKSTYKPIFTAGTEPLLNREMLALCRFMKEFTLCTFGEAVHAIVPGAALTKITEYYRALPADPEKLSSEMQERAQLIYHLLEGKKRLTKQQIQSEFPFDCTPYLASLRNAGYLEKQSVTRQPDEGRVRLLYSLTESAVQRLQTEEMPDILKPMRSEQQRTLFRELARLAKPDTPGSRFAEEKSLLETCGISAATGRNCLKRLIDQGLVLVMEETDYRDPFRLSEDEQEAPLPPVVLTEEQQAALNTIGSLYRSGQPKAVLLHGVTGSGKTNVMLAAIEQVLEDGRGVILLVPEIALTPQTVSIYRRRFGERIAVIHSSLSAGEKLDAWRRIRDGLADVVIGTRSAIFAPLPKLGMILIDEEHEYTYKSDTNPKYHAQDIARWRCGEHKAVMLLASATPSVTSYYKAKTGVYTLVELKNRYNNAALPQVEICDMRGTSPTSPVGDVLAARLREDKAAGNQSILFLNRRGYNHFVSCRSCGKSIQCPHCSVSMTYHTLRRGKLQDTAEDPEAYQKLRRDNGILACHTCGYRTPVPDVCPVCGKPHFLFMGCGTQKAEDDIETQFPDLRVIRMDTDTTHGKFSHETYLTRFREGEADVLLGTQMVTKGHDFPKVATVGVLNADGSLFVDDYRASERTFSMLTQVIGRAGRGDVPGKAIIQTWNPDNEILHLAATQDYPRFYEGEIRLRKALCFPPFCDIAVITVSGSDEAVLGNVVTSLHQRIREYAASEFDDIPLVLFGPFEAPVYRVQNVYRMRFVLKCRLNKRARAFIDRLLCEYSGGILPAVEKKPKKPVGSTEVRLNSRGDRRISVTVDLNPSTI